ncbi:uncharacterized protein TM35_000541050 [Trypanosoma theileri]|uniref:Uncharacterized protein n=1 Tax=Trypanosoma theileri TaxID=67003 RepID=A0A1X0NH18_9TRYP|nr:uncharacterized protein TM35_000541050 [Trypanosoma theileri]ORC83881.1 hypothetical protein TM35_000541050 [Trypanosoma theileri]
MSFVVVWQMFPHNSGKRTGHSIVWLPPLVSSLSSPFFVLLFHAWISLYVTACDGTVVGTLLPSPSHIYTHTLSPHWDTEFLSCVCVCDTLFYSPDRCCAYVQS